MLWKICIIEKTLYYLLSYVIDCHIISIMYVSDSNYKAKDNLEKYH